MPNGVASEGLSLRYHLLNIRSRDTEVLLSSESVADNIMAVLTGMRSSPEVVRRILERIAVLEKPDREMAFEALILLSSCDNRKRRSRRRRG